MTRFIIHDEKEIHAMVDVPNASFIGPMPKGTKAYRTNQSIEDVYVKDGQVLTKRLNPTVLVDNALMKVPPASQVEINGIRYPTENNPRIGLMFDQPGSYQITVISHGYYDAEFTIDY